MMYKAGCKTLKPGIKILQLLFCGCNYNTTAIVNLKNKKLLQIFELAIFILHLSNNLKF